MTWGQLRFQLMQSAPGAVSLDLLDEWLNTRYEQVLEATDWSGTRAHATVETLAAYQSVSDSVTLTVGSANVTGSGTAFAGGWVGRRFYRPGDSVFYTIGTVTNGTSLSLDRPYEGNGIDAPATVYAGASYAVMQHIYALPSDCASVITILDPVSGLPLRQLSKPQLDASVGQRTLVEDPASFAVYDDSSESAPPVLHQVEFYPPPSRARGFTLNYTRAANGFDGTNLATAPLPFVSETVLLAGARADLFAHLGKLDQAGAYEGKFREELKRLLMVEHAQRRPATPFRMAGRFTRHRMGRAGRSFANPWGPGAGGPS